MVERLAETWATREYPVLLEIARRLESPDTEPVFIGQVAAAVQIPTQQANIAAEALEEDGFIIGTGTAETRGPIVITGITAKARREVGLWPSAELGVERLVAALDQLIEQTADVDERTRWQRIRDHVTENGAQVGWSLVTAVLTGQLPGQ